MGRLRLWVRTGCRSIEMVTSCENDGVCAVYYVKLAHICLVRWFYPVLTNSFDVFKIKFHYHTIAYDGLSVEI